MLGVDPHKLTPNDFLATASDVVPKAKLPNCTVCYGCNTHLAPMDAESKFLGTVYANEKGATSSWLFRATTNLTKSGVAVVKVYCVPIPKRAGGKVPTCSPITVMKNMQLLVAIEKISQDCGLDDIIPKVWIDKVEGVIPELGYHIRWYGLWMEHVKGISLENFLHKGTPVRQPPSVVLDMFHNKMNKTQVVRSAIFDLLTSQCDRHAQVHMGHHGQTWRLLHACRMSHHVDHGCNDGHSVNYLHDSLSMGSE